MNKKVLIFTAREGHLSMAQVTAQILKEKGFKTKLNDFLSSKSFNMYLPFYRYFPFLFKVPYEIGTKETVQKGVKIFVEKLLEKEVKNEIKDYKPDLIISTHFAYNPALAKILDYQKTPIPFLNLIPDPWKIHPLLFSTIADFNLVYDEKGIKIGQKNKIPPEKLIAIGWLTRKEFYEKADISKLRKQFGLKRNIFTLLICGGSEGTNSILKIMPVLLTIKKPLQIIAVCGTNNNLYHTFCSLQKIAQKLGNLKNKGLKEISQRLNLKIFKFVNNLAQLMQVSDLVIGKAGPNLLFEAVACRKPFLAICHISGQEEGNLELIRRKGLGLVEENPLKTIKLLKKIVTNPKILNRFLANIKKERLENLQAEKKIIKLIKDLLNSAKTQRE